ncbi:hypothetical protein AC1031_022055 [Aphanomyces cochlioides]|nr:hypothetical protein AC1031_022055 [Aphanomyces cochlioides]
MTKADTLIHDVHNLTSRPLPWMPSGVAEDKTPMVVDGMLVLLFTDTNAFYQVNDGDCLSDEEARRVCRWGWQRVGVPTWTDGGYGIWRVQTISTLLDLTPVNDSPLLRALRKPYTHGILLSK